jgi:hypothetical protein
VYGLDVERAVTGFPHCSGRTDVMTCAETTLPVRGAAAALSAVHPDLAAESIDITDVVSR